MRQPPDSAPTRRPRWAGGPESLGGDPRIIAQGAEQVELPATLTLADLARDLRCCKRHAASLRARGRLPAPIEGLRPLLRFDRRVIARWIELGCPSRERFEEIERGGRP